MKRMPSRPVIIAVIAFWLLTTGWFVVNEIVPKWRAGEAPPYTIEFADEVIRNPVPYRWVCTFNDRKLGAIRTELVNDPTDDTFEFSARSSGLILPITETVSLKLTDFEDRVRVTRAGELRGLITSGSFAIEVAGLPISGRLRMAAVAHGGLLDRHVQISSALFGESAPALDPVPAPRGSILNPMHPVPRITGLRPGQSWRQPLVDPRADMMRAAIEQSGFASWFHLKTTPGVLTAVVLSEVKTLEWEGLQQPCLVIEYRDEDYTAPTWARTWVRRSDGLVIRQEAGAQGDKLVLQRE
jgi:hypothetical protein